MFLEVRVFPASVVFFFGLLTLNIIRCHHIVFGSIKLNSHPFDGKSRNLTTVRTANTITNTKEIKTRQYYNSTHCYRR